MAKEPVETEIKIAVPDAARARSLLRRAGFVRAGRRTLEINHVFDSPQFQLRRRGLLLRIRWYGKTSSLTWKGQSTPGRLKSRVEQETKLADGHTLEAIFGHLGLRRTWRYEKFRTPFHHAGQRGEAVLDETPIGTFLELEGSARWIDATARKLGFSESDYVRLSYGALYAQYLKGRGEGPEDMVFPPAKSKKKRNST